jgi:ferredoxin
MKIQEFYELCEKIGTMTFSTIHGNEVQSRIAHFNGYDEHGIYFRSMWNKPFARQLLESKTVTVCGITDSSIYHRQDDMNPYFPAGFSIRLVGDVEFVSEDQIRQRAVGNERLQLAVFDMDRYPAMKKGNFLITRAKVEVYDYDFDCKNRDHKVLRTRFSFGDFPFNLAGPRITDACIACGKCFSGCTFKAIEKGSPYRIRPERCDDCGSCLEVCPVNAIEISQAF